MAKSKRACQEVCLVPMQDGAVQDNWKWTGVVACSRSGAIKAARNSGYSVILSGGLAEQSSVMGQEGWMVTVRAKRR